MNKFVLILLLLTGVACQQGNDLDSAGRQVPKMSLSAPGQPEMQESPEDAPPPPAEPEQPVTSVRRQLIRTAQVRMRVADFASSGRTIEGAVRQVGGQITSSNETKTDNTIENSLTIRVPANRFDTLLELVLKPSIFTDTKTISVDDVTRRYVDVEARIRSKRAVEETYLNLLKKARNVEEILKIEAQLGNIREEREVQEATLRQLKDEVALSTLNLMYYQETEAALRPEDPFYAQIWRNLTDGFRLLGSVFVGLFYVLPLALFGVAVVWGILRWRRGRKKDVQG